jgi:hypothetical protein
MWLKRLMKQREALHNFTELCALRVLHALYLHDLSERSFELIHAFHLSGKFHFRHEVFAERVHCGDVNFRAREYVRDVAQQTLSIACDHFDLDAEDLACRSFTPVGADDSPGFSGFHAQHI